MACDARVRTRLIGELRGQVAANVVATEGSLLAKLGLAAACILQLG